MICGKPTKTQLESWELDVRMSVDFISKINLPVDNPFRVASILFVHSLSAKQLWKLSAVINVFDSIKDQRFMKTCGQWSSLLQALRHIE